MAIICVMCGTSNKDGVKFCAACGKPLTEEDPTTAKKKSSNKSPAKTVLFGMKSPVLDNQSTPSSEASSKAETGETSSKAETTKTVLGLPAAGGKPGAASQPPQRPQAIVSTPTLHARIKPPSKQDSDPRLTDMGIGDTPSQTPEPHKTSKPPMAKPSKPPGASSIESTSSKSKGHLGKKTVLGMPAMNLDTPDALLQEIKKTPQIPSLAEEDKKEEPLKSTTQKVSATKKEEPLKSATQKVSAAKKESFKETKSEKPKQGTAATSKKGTRPIEPAPKIRESSFNEWPDLQIEPKRKTLSIIITLAAIVVTVALGALVYLVIFGQKSPLIPQVFSAGDGKRITVILPFPNSPSGTSIQVGSQNIPITQEQARVDIDIGTLKLGVNQIPFAYQEPGESKKQMSFPITLRHSISSDLSGLATENPFFTIRFQIANGIELAVEGKPVQLVDGTYIKKVMLSELQSPPDAESENWLYRATFQLSDAQGGSTEQGQHLVVIPLTKLQLDRPADNATVVSESVTVSGITENGAQITVNGQAVGVAARAFGTIVPLPSIGKNKIEIVARATGKAPRKRVVQVTRVQSLEPAINQWAEDLDTSLEYPTIGRDANAHIGKKIKLQGRIVNISTEKGITAFLIYIAEGCPAGARCAVYGVFRGETDAGLQSWVNVYGTVKGTRSVDLPNGQKLIVPAVEAAFVQKSEGNSSSVSQKKK